MVLKKIGCCLNSKLVVPPKLPGNSKMEVIMAGDMQSAISSLHRDAKFCKSIMINKVQQLSSIYLAQQAEPELVVLVIFSGHRTIDL